MTPQQSEFSKHGLRSLLQPQCLFRLLFMRRQRPEQQSLSRSHRSPFWRPHATSFAAASGVDASARPESATAARSNPRRRMFLVKASKRSESMGTSGVMNVGCGQRDTLTAAYHGVEIIRSGQCLVFLQSHGRRLVEGAVEGLSGFRLGRSRCELRCRGSTGTDRFRPGALASSWGAVRAPGATAARRWPQRPLAPRSGARAPQPGSRRLPRAAPQPASRSACHRR